MSYWIYVSECDLFVKEKYQKSTPAPSKAEKSTPASLTHINHFCSKNIIFCWSRGCRESCISHHTVDTPSKLVAVGDLTTTHRKHPVEIVKVVYLFRWTLSKTTTDSSTSLDAFGCLNCFTIPFLPKDFLILSIKQYILTLRKLFLASFLYINFRWISMYFYTTFTTSTKSAVYAGFL